MVHLFSSECIIKSGRADFLLLSLFSRIFQLFLHINTWLPCVASLILVYRELTVHSDVAPKTVPAAQPHWHHGDHTHLQFTPGVKPITMHPGGLLTGSTPLSQEEMESKWKERDVRRPGGVWTDAAQAGHFRVREDQRGHQGHHRNETENQPRMWLYLTNRHSWLLPSLFLLCQASPSSDKIGLENSVLRVKNLQFNA